MQVPVVQYDQMVSDYEKNLNLVLRNFGADQGFLDMWVPDPDTTMSIVNMIESAEATQMNEFVIVLSRKTEEALDKSRLQDMVGDIAKLEFSSNDSSPTVRVVIHG